MNEIKKENFVYELFYNIYYIIFEKTIDKKYVNNRKYLAIVNKCFKLCVVEKDVKLWKKK
ncbi:MAG: hypothetical protein V8R51_00480 [Clostridia bacterium]